MAGSEHTPSERREVLDSLGKGITSHAADGQIIGANRAAQEILGLEESERRRRSRGSENLRGSAGTVSGGSSPTTSGTCPSRIWRLGGWKDAQTLLKCYLTKDEAAMVEALRSGARGTEPKGEEGGADASDDISYIASGSERREAEE